MADLLLLTDRKGSFGRRDAWAVAALILLSSFWLATLALPFFFTDDPSFVMDNPFVKGGLSWRDLAWAFTTTFPDYWHPLTWLSLQLDTSLFGSAAWGYHLTNALLHMANVLLLYLLLRVIFGGVWRSLLAAAIFSIHPQRVESVAWITERKDVLALFFGLLALLAYVRFVRARGGGRYLLVCVLFVASVMAKPLLLTFPVLLLLLDFWPLQRLRRGTLWKLVREKVPLFLVALAAGLNTSMAVIAGGTIRGSAGESLKQAAMNYVLYLRDTFYFGDLCFFSKPLEHIGGWELAGAAMILGGVTAGLLLWARCGSNRGKAALVGWLWFVIALLPTSGISQAGYSMRGDRFTYVPAIGLIFGAVFGVVPSLGTVWRRRIGIAVGVAVVAVLLAFSARRLWLWRDPLLLYEHDLKLDPGNAYLEDYAGVAAKAEGLDDLADRHFRRAAALDPSEFQYQGIGHAKSRPALKAP